MEVRTTTTTTSTTTTSSSTTTVTRTFTTSLSSTQIRTLQTSINLITSTLSITRIITSTIKTDTTPIILKVSKLTQSSKYPYIYITAVPLIIGVILIIIIVKKCKKKTNIPTPVLIEMQDIRRNPTTHEPDHILFNTPFINDLPLQNCAILDGYHVDF
jgi:hypothetical protein